MNHGLNREKPQAQNKILKDKKMLHKYKENKLKSLSIALKIALVTIWNTAEPENLNIFLKNENVEMIDLF